VSVGEAAGDWRGWLGDLRCGWVFRGAELDGTVLGSPAVEYGDGERSDG